MDMQMESDKGRAYRQGGELVREKGRIERLRQEREMV